MPPLQHLAAIAHVDTKTEAKSLRVTLPRALKQNPRDPKPPGHFRFRVKALSDPVTVIDPHTGEPLKEPDGRDVSVVAPKTTATFAPSIVSTPHPKGEPLEHPKTGDVVARPGQTVVMGWQRLDDQTAN